MPTATLSPFFSLGNYKSISNVAQQRPNQNNSRTDALVTPMEAMYHSSDMSSPLDENATNSIASTLASLGLNEEDTNSHQTRGNASYFEHAPITRHRSFTVSSQMIENQQQQQNNRDMMSYNLFTHSSKPTAKAAAAADHSPTSIMNDSTGAMRRRPRAISLGIADAHQLHQQFSPFEQHGDTNVNLTDTLPFQTPRTLFTHMDDEDDQTVN